MGEDGDHTKPESPGRPSVAGRWMSAAPRPSSGAALGMLGEEGGERCAGRGLEGSGLIHSATKQPPAPALSLGSLP